MSEIWFNCQQLKFAAAIRRLFLLYLFDMLRFFNNSRDFIISPSVAIEAQQGTFFQACYNDALIKKKMKFGESLVFVCSLVRVSMCTFSVGPPR